ncbi:L-threonylcarbamoyladenylate synthase [Flavobacterium sp.]|uniref:L-threonylcarbamoyladenylate synthase n=1 Tax=Flavobacterium sp. TaxID=239 RepID=UPI00286D6BED|nr:L-threonylcarbamoyladenylate synthase [Flavobacterium sp.]
MIQISKDISKAVALLNQNQLIAIPTETVYGLAGNIYNEEAIKSIFKVKNRPFFNPLIVHIKSIKQLDELAKDIPKKAILLAEAFWPGSLTLVLKKQDIVPDLVTAGKDSVAIRIPNHPTTLALLESLDFPLAAPSANPFGSISPTKASHVADYFTDTLAMVLDGGECENGIESTIIGFENNEPVVFRLGSIAVEEIEKVIGKVQIKNKKDNTPDAPGMLSRHYAPKTTTYLKEDVAHFVKEFTNKKIGVLLFDKKIQNVPDLYQEILSENSNLKEATSNLYAAMHRLDKLNLDVIIAQRFPDVDLGKSINDRLERATKK